MRITYAINQKSTNFALEHLGRADGCSPRAVCGGCRPLLLELGNGIFGTTPTIQQNFFSGRLYGLMVRVYPLAKLRKEYIQRAECSIA